MIADSYGDGLPLIMVHGFGVDHRSLLPLEDALSERKWKRIYLDLPWAEGATDTGVETPCDVADGVLAEVLEIIGDHGTFAILGNSFGAMIARHVAHLLPDRCLGVATIAGVFCMESSRRTLPPHTVLHHDESVLERAGGGRGAFEDLAVIQSEAVLTAFQTYIQPGALGAKSSVLARIGSRQAESYDPEAEAATPFPAPAVHVFGRQDSVVGYADGLARIEHYPRGTYAVLDGAGHLLQLEQPVRVGALLGDWLDRVEAEAA